MEPEQPSQPQSFCYCAQRPSPQQQISSQSRMTQQCFVLWIQPNLIERPCAAARALELSLSPWQFLSNPLGICSSWYQSKNHTSFLLPCWLQPLLLTRLHCNFQIQLSIHLLQMHLRLHLASLLWLKLKLKQKQLPALPWIDDRLDHGQAFCLLRLSQLVQQGFRHVNDLQHVQQRKVLVVCYQSNFGKCMAFRHGIQIKVALASNRLDQIKRPA